jgi:ribosome-associated heat shock protein Hsp15
VTKSLKHADEFVTVRLDKWLWAARFFKTRRLAKQAIEGGKVHCDGQRVKVAKTVSVGDQLSVRQGFDEKQVVVLALSEQRRGAMNAGLLYQETEASQIQRAERAAQRKAGMAGYIASDHPPNKKERRQIHRFRRVESGDE